MIDQGRRTPGRTSPTSRIGVVLVAAALLAMAATGCGALPGAGSDEAGSGGRTISDLLSSVPDTPDNRTQLQVTDHAGLARAAGVTWPLEAGAVDGFAATLLENGELFAPESAKLFAIDQAWRSELGFGATDIAAVAETGVPPSVISVYRTTATPDAIATAVAADPVWSPDLRSEERDGATIYTWGDDPLRADVGRTSPARPLGQGGVLAVTGDDGLVLRSTDLEQVDAALAARAGDGPSLADDEGFTGIAAALDDQGCYHALLSGRPPVLDPLLFLGGRADPASVKAIQERLAIEPVLPAYQVLGIGEAVDEEGKGYLVFAFSTRSGDEAKAVADGFTKVVTEGTSMASNKPWSDLLTVRKATTEGSIAVITVDTERLGAGYEAFVRNDSLLAVP